VRTKVSKSTIKKATKLLDEDEKILLGKLGASFTLDYLSKDRLYSLHYGECIKFGAEIMYTLWYEMYLKICEPLTRKPNLKILDLLDAKNDTGRLIEAVVLDIVNIYGIRINTATVAATLLVKKGLVWLCSQKQPDKPPRTIKEIILDEKQSNQEKAK
jgi:hypothetical protein